MQQVLHLHLHMGAPYRPRRVDLAYLFNRIVILSVTFMRLGIILLLGSEFIA